jgi:hypothetical protein
MRSVAARLALLGVLWLLAVTAWAAPRIGVATMQPGEVFFERFGHNAIVVVDPASGDAISYNFGFFDPGESDFVGNFARGHMMYYLMALPFEQDLLQYRDSGRGAGAGTGRRAGRTGQAGECALPLRLLHLQLLHAGAGRPRCCARRHAEVAARRPFARQYASQ